MDFNPDILKQGLFTLIRYFGPPIIGWMTLKLGITEDQATAVLVGLGTYAISMIWALFNKVHYERKVNTALDLPAATSKDKLKDIIAKGQGAAATEAK